MLQTAPHIIYTHLVQTDIQIRLISKSSYTLVFNRLAVTRTSDAVSSTNSHLTNLCQCKFAQIYTQDILVLKSNARCLFQTLFRLQTN